MEVFGVIFALWTFARWLKIPQMMACRKVRAWRRRGGED